jgi:hypothetical protein
VRFPGTGAQTSGVGGESASCGFVDEGGVKRVLPQKRKGREGAQRRGILWRWMSASVSGVWEGEWKPRNPRNFTKK